jgi:hypothetical protein
MSEQPHESARDAWAMIMRERKGKPLRRPRCATCGGGSDRWFCCVLPEYKPVCRKCAVTLRPEEYGTGYAAAATRSLTQ